MIFSGKDARWWQVIMRQPGYWLMIFAAVTLLAILISDVSF